MEGKRPGGQNVLLLMLCAVLSIPLYIVLHELGHCVVAAACGARIVEFSVLTAHMSSVGGHYSRAGELWLHANGAALPLILALVWTVCYRSGTGRRLYVISSFFFLLVPMWSLLAWVVVPVLYLLGKAPAGDDCTQFVENISADVSPLFVSWAALLLILLCLFLLLWKRLPQDVLRVMAV